MNTAQYANLTTLKMMKAELDNVSTLEAAGALYEDWVGYNIIEEEDLTYAELRDVMDDYLKECCVAMGVHCTDVFGEIK